MARCVAALGGLMLGLVLAGVGVQASSASPAGSTNTRGGGPLPDSLLARVGTHRHVSLTDFRRSWHQVAPPQRPDSLTPESARQFLDLLIGKEVLGETALRTRWVWTARESAEYLGLADRLVMGAMLDSALRSTSAARAAAGDTIRDLEKLGMVTRERAVGALNAAFDTTLTRRLAAIWDDIPRPSRDSTVMVQIRTLGLMPRVAPADTGRALARTKDGVFLVSELVQSWARLDPLQRPRVSTPSQIEDLVDNALFERILRRDAVRRRVLEWPAIAGALQQKREYIAVTHLVTREVYDSLNADSTVLRRYYAEHHAEFGLPMRVRGLEMDLPTRASASSMALELRDAVRAESLAARGRRSGANYVVEIAAAGDSARFARALAAGTGAVLGPDSSASGWRVLRVLEVIPARERTYQEAQPFVHHAWYGAEGERRMVETLARLRRGVTVTVNDRALRRLVAAGDLPAPGPAGAR